MQRAIVLLITLSLILPAGAFAGAHESAGGQAGDNKANAEELVNSADRALGFVVKSARDSQDQALNPQANDAKPFWQALGRLNDALDKTQRGLTLQDPSFHRALNDATQYIVAAQVTYGAAGASDPAVADGLQKVEDALRLVNENYSKAAVRASQDTPMTPEEVPPRRALDVFSVHPRKSRNTACADGNVVRTMIHNTTCLEIFFDAIG